jgi:hypothetical protein
LVGNLVRHDSGGHANAAHVEQEQEERFDRQEANAVVCPRAVVVHLVHAFPAFRAVVHSVDLLRATLVALTFRSVSSPVLFCLWVIVPRFQRRPFFFVFGFLKHLLCSEMLPLHITWVVSSLRHSVTPLSHSSKSKQQKQVKEHLESVIIVIPQEKSPHGHRE